MCKGIKDGHCVVCMKRLIGKQSESIIMHQANTSTLLEQSWEWRVEFVVGFLSRRNTFEHDTWWRSWSQTVQEQE